MTTTRTREYAQEAHRVIRHPVRRAFKWAVIGLAVVVLLIAGYWVLAASKVAPAPPPIAAPADTAPQVITQPAVPATPGQANGCLGGAEPIAGLLAAQQQATIDVQGAAAFALALVRYSDTYPADPHMAATAAQVATSGYQTELLAGLSQSSTRSAASGTISSASIPTAPDQYRVISADPSAASITISVVSYWKVTKQGSQQQFRGFGTLVLDVVNGQWRLAAAPTTAPADPYAPLAGAPWNAYAGVC